MISEVFGVICLTVSFLGLYDSSKKEDILPWVRDEVAGGVLSVPSATMRVSTSSIVEESRLSIAVSPSYL